MIMKYKVIGIKILIIIIAMTLFVTWYENVQKDSAFTLASLNPNYKVYLITMDKENQYWYYINEGAMDMAAFWGITYLWDAPMRRSIERQIEIVNKAVEEGADAILLSAIDARRLAAPVAAAKEKGVKIIYVDSPANEEAIITLATDNYEAGRVAGQTMLEELDQFNIRAGTIGIVAIDTVTDNTMRREAGFREVIVEDGRFTLLNTEYANSDLVKAKAAATRMIKENTNLVGIFGTDEISSIGVGRSIQADNNKIVGIGFDATDVTLKLMQTDSLKAIITQNPYTMGYLGIAEAIAALEGMETGPKNMNTGVSVMRKR